MENLDKDVQDLFAIVQTKKDEIAKAEKPNWLTNASFGYDKNSSNRINIHTTTDLEELVSILAFLIEKNNSFNLAKVELKIDVKFKWMGYSFDEWLSDIKTRITKIQISKKRQELESYETKLNALVSPELKRKMEIDEIKKSLNVK